MVDTLNREEQGVAVPFKGEVVMTTAVFRGIGASFTGQEIVNDFGGHDLSAQYAPAPGQKKDNRLLCPYLGRHGRFCRCKRTWHLYL